MYLELLRGTELIETIFDCHVKQILYGSINNVLLLGLLSRAEGGALWKRKLFNPEPQGKLHEIIHIAHIS